MNPGASGIAEGRARQPATTLLVFGEQFLPGGMLTGTKRLELESLLDIYRNPSSYCVRVASADAFTFIRGQLAPASY